MRCLLLTLCLLFFGQTNADEPRLPLNMNQPVTLYAKTMQEGGNLVIKFKVPQFAPVQQQRTVSMQVPVKKMQDGKEITTYEIVTKTVTVTEMKPAKWIETKISVSDPQIKVHDARGKSISKDQLASLLTEEQTVLVSTTGPVDPYHLQTTKSDTLVFQAPCNVLETCALGQPAPISVPRVTSSAPATPQTAPKPQPPATKPR